MFDTFPFETFRKGQKEAIEKAYLAFKRGTRFVVLEAPTGAGKSAIAVTLARQASSAYILTAQKILQQQYIRDFPSMSLMKGRSNYPCIVAPTHAAAAPCIVGRKFPQCNDCPYFVQKDISMQAHSTIMNYAYYLAELNYAGGFQPRELLVLDEAHNAESALMNFIQIQLTDNSLMRVGINETIPRLIEDEAQYFDFALDLADVIRSRGKEIDKLLKEKDLPEDIALEQMQHKQWCDNQSLKLKQLHYSREEFDVEWVVERRLTRDGQSLVFKPVTVAPFAEDYLFNFGEKLLMLSATILDPITYLRSLGIANTEAQIIKIDSDFPVENRPIFVKPIAKLTRHHIENDLPKLVTEISTIMDKHSDQKGIIHTHTYKIAKYIKDNLPKKHKERLLTHINAEERDMVLEKHTKGPRPTVLISPSMTEGIDLTGNLSRWQVICKVPYPYLGDPQVARRRKLDPAWYGWRTALKIVQAYGRSIRSNDDFASTYILDADFETFVKRQRKSLPLWFLEAIQ